MSLGLTLLQTSPATNPDRNIVKVNFSGIYPAGGDLIPLTNIADPQVLVQVPLNNPTQAPPPVTPYILNEWLDGYYGQIQRVVTGSGLAAQTNFYLRMFNPGGVEFAANTPYSNASVLPTPSPVATQLGVAAAFAVLASAGITNSGNTVVTGGNIGSYATATETGFPPGVLTAPAAVNNAGAQAAQTALTAAITYYQGLTATLSGLSNLSTGGNGSSASTYTPGVYVGSAGLTMPTGIILDAQGNPNATFVFVAGSTIDLASGQTIALVNGAQAANVVFVAGSAFTSVATSTVNGNILAVSGITLGGGVLNGRALATTGPVTISAATAITVPALANSGSGVSPILNGEMTLEILCPTVHQ
ncbi:MAG TPA: ice-binding family protein [Terracidiphilus sp.]|jgi:hypothetical protein|nr:ice-binding family protein [Terracidiphilus sp.]